MKLNHIYNDDCLKVLAGFDANSIDVCVTDPPYFLDGLCSEWDSKEVASKKNMKVVTSLPSGMRFDKSQGKKFREWYTEVSKEVFRVLKPGSFFFSFSSPRLYHNMVCGIEDAEFLIKDQFIWLYTQNQPKAMSLNHVIDRLNIIDEEKESLKKHLSGWKTPQVKSCHEPIVLAQKPLEGSFLDNYTKHGVGLVDTNVRLGDDMFPSNVISTDEILESIDHFFLVNKPKKKEKGEFNTHKTVKPLELLIYLISLTTRENGIVLDPFVGSGSTCIASRRINRYYVGIDVNSEYIEIANRRLEEEYE